MTDDSKKEGKPPDTNDCDLDFRSDTMYFLVLDRFNEGTPGKAGADAGMSDPSRRDSLKHWGGDLQGLIDKLPYLEGIGISAVWTTPLFEQVRGMTEEEHPQAPIHGYWTSDFKRINAQWVNDPSETRLFERSDTVFDSLLHKLHSRGMKYVLDIVCNHSSPQTTEGKGKLYDDGKLIADFENDRDHWYHHYGETVDWDDEWQVQNCELAGLATFNENNVLYRNYIKDAIRLWVRKGVDGLRIDTVKHMPLWFWQEFNYDIGEANRGVFRFGEWIYNTPEKEASVVFANSSGMSLLDFGFCEAVRACFAGNDGLGFKHVQAIMDLDANYFGVTELVTLFENHDMPRFQSLGVSDRGMDLALVLLMTSRGIPCLYYGCEQYLHVDTEGGKDPYNRPMMERWDETPATAIIRILANERKNNKAVQYGGQWPKWVDENRFVYLRRYRGSRCLVFLNKGDRTSLSVGNLDFPDGEYRCSLTGSPVVVSDGAATIELPECTAMVIVTREEAAAGKVLIRCQINGVPALPGDRVALIGSFPELGEWDLRRAVDLEIINENTWFVELTITESAGRGIGYKYVVFKGGSEDRPRRESTTVRQRTILAEGAMKWRDRWEL